MSVRQCRVSCLDLQGTEHSVEVTAASLYEAVAQALVLFKADQWVEEIGKGPTTLSISVAMPAVEHKVRVQDFEKWLNSPGRTPAEICSKNRIRQLLE